MNMTRNTFICILFLAWSIIIQSSAMAEPTVVDMVLCGDISSGKEPLLALSNRADFNHGSYSQTKIPVVETRKLSTVYCWSKIRSSGEEIIIHKWYKDNIEFPLSSTYTPFPDNAIRYLEKLSISVDIPKVVAAIELMIKPSKGFRTWSSKEIFAPLRGDWEVKIATSEAPDKILGSLKFKVE